MKKVITATQDTKNPGNRGNRVSCKNMKLTYGLAQM